MDVDLVHVYWY